MKDIPPVQNAEENLLQTLLEIIQTQNVNEPQDLSVLNGLAGKLLFQWYAAKSPTLKFDENKFQLQLAQLIEWSPAITNITNFGYGVAGFGWFMELLLREREDGYCADFNQDIENFLVSELKKNQPWRGEIEFVLGLSGIAVFAARRLQSNRGLLLYKMLVDIFENLAVYESVDVCAWPVPTNSVFGLNKLQPDTVEYNLGLAHGMPAIICALLPAISHHEIGSRAKKLVSDSCNWLIKQRLTDRTACSTFANSSCSEEPSRLAWCYGDLTIAFTLARAGKALERPDLIEFACEVGLRSATRTAEKSMSADAGVCDTGICHGSAGLMLIFQLLHQIIPKPEFQHASDYWYAKLIEKYQQNGISGLYAFRADGMREETGLLEGFSGIGLALLARQGISPDWADALLLA